MPITWNSSLETGIRQIDQQHQELVEMINDLESAHLSGQDSVALRDVLPKLKAYVLFHFHAEESLAANVASGTQHLNLHLEEHNKFRDKLAAIKPELLVDKPQAVKDIVHFLQTWLVEHIMHTDKQLAELNLAHQHAAKDSRAQ